MGEDLGDERDPLLVRPFVLPDGARQEPPSSGSTWPVEQRAGELPTQLLPTVPGDPADEPESPGSHRRRRTLLLIGAGVVAVATVAGYALLRPEDRQDAWMSLPGQSLPAAIGPATSTGVAPSSIPNDAGADGGGQDGSEEGTQSTPPARTASASTPSGGSSVSPSAGSSGGSSSSSVPVAPVAPIDLAPSPIATGSGTLVTGNGLCLDLRGGEASEGRDVHIDDCNGTSPQRWKLNSDRTLEVLGMCAYLVGDGTVDLTRCDGRTTAQWQLMNDGVLTNASNGRCLTDPFWGARPGNAVIVATCTGGSNQRWSFR